MITSRVFLRRAATVALALASVAAPVAAQTPSSRLDRSVQPTPGRVPELRVPTWTRAKLSNGAELIVSQKRDLPLVSFTINFVGGRNNFEPAGKAGSLLLAMLTDALVGIAAGGVVLALVTGYRKLRGRAPA